MWYEYYDIRMKSVSETTSTCTTMRTAGHHSRVEPDVFLPLPAFHAAALLLLLVRGFPFRGPDAPCLPAGPWP